jgi:hypothetical protein
MREYLAILTEQAVLWIDVVAAPSGCTMRAG